MQTRVREAARTGTVRPSADPTRIVGKHPPTRAEWVLAVGALFLLGRTPVLFIRERIGSALGAGRPGRIWQEDLFLLVVFTLLEAIVLVVAIRRARPSALLRQPLLLAFLAIAWLSMAWSLEPQVTLRRALLLVGTAAVGWYVGDRFSVEQQATVTTLLGVVAVVASCVAFVAWPEQATSTNGVPGEWSGVYVNRNLLALVISLGLLASVFIAPFVRWRLLWATAVLALAGLLVQTGSRTGPLALAITGGVLLLVVVLRYLAAGRLTPAGGAVVGLAFIACVWAGARLFWTDILHSLGREPRLSGRVEMWEVDRFFASAYPWHGWGFEAIWTNERAIKQARLAARFYPYSAHSGYYDLLLGVGRVGLVVFVGFLMVSAWRAFRYAWRRSDLPSLWPLCLIVFAVLVNFSESLFVSTEATLALTIAAAVAAAQGVRERPQTAAPGYPGPSHQGAGDESWAKGSQGGRSARLHDHRS